MPELLSGDTVAAMLKNLAGWSGDTKEIARTVELSSFPAAIQVVNRVAEVAEEMDHHPDIDIRWATLTFRCATHSMGGVTERDLALAERINAIVDESRHTG